MHCFSALKPGCHWCKQRLLLADTYRALGDAHSVLDP